MKIEKWKFNGEEIDVPILKKKKKEENDIPKELENTLNIAELFIEEEENNE